MPSAMQLAAVQRRNAPAGRRRRASFRAASPLSTTLLTIRARFALLPGVCALCLIIPLALAAQRGHPTQYDVEAVYLYQFGKFVQWPKPPAPAEHFKICVMGRDPFARTLDNTIAGETIGNAPLEADRVDTIDDTKRCRILFISASEDARIEEILNRLGNAPVLTVSDLPGFMARGGMIQFLVRGNRVRFEINVGTAKQAGLAVSSQLLKVAAAVRGAPAAGANQ